MRRGFTLIELLIVIAIIAILAVVVILVINPAELLRQSRDSNRLADMANLNTALGIFSEDIAGGSLGSASTTYLSIADPSATSTAGDQCQGLGLPSAPSGTTYHCAASSTLRNTDSTGWIPIKFSSISVGNPLGTLPVDPTNATSSFLYYSYNTNGTQFQANTHFESQKYLSTEAKSGGYDPVVYSIGNNPNVAPWTDGMIGYWAFNEGSGSTANDSSGMGFNGAWTGTQTGSSGYYSAGKVGLWSGTFDGSTDVVTMGAMNIWNEKPFTVVGWIYPTASKMDEGFFGACQSPQTMDNCLHLAIRNGVPYMGFYNDDIQGGSTSLNTWYEIAFTYSGGAGGTRTIYLNGAQVATGVSTAGLQVPNGTTSTIGVDEAGNLQGNIDEVRVYNRALSASEVAAMYMSGR